MQHGFLKDPSFSVFAIIWPDYGSSSLKGVRACGVCVLCSGFVFKRGTRKNRATAAPAAVGQITEDERTDREEGRMEGRGISSSLLSPSLSLSLSSSTEGRMASAASLRLGCLGLQTRSLSPSLAFPPSNSNPSRPPSSVRRRFRAFLPLLLLLLLLRFLAWHLELRRRMNRNAVAVTACCLLARLLALLLLPSLFPPTSLSALLFFFFFVLHFVPPPPPRHQGLRIMCHLQQRKGESPTERTASFRRSDTLVAKS